MNVIQVLEKIDSGGFGVVEKVLCDDNLIYARKTFSVNFPATNEIKENALLRFKREAIFQESFKHRNIVPILHKEIDIEIPYYIMPLAENTVKNIEFTNNEDIVRMLLDVMSGLEAMHNMSYYHRDLKPGNILRFRDDQGFFYYAIGDFGLLSIDQTKITELTPLLMKKGSDYYTAPEIVANMVRASVQSDIFSLGCLLHDYFGKSDRIPTQPIVEDGAVGKIIANCTHKKVSRRFSSIELLREAFVSISHDGVVVKSPEGQKLINYVESEEHIGIEEWEEIIEFLGNVNNNQEDIDSLFRLINIQRIIELIELDMALGNSYGILFSEWVREKSFVFDFCDVIGNRLDKIIELCSVNVKTQCIMALLLMGTSHNRFYVEELCYKRMSGNLDDNLAQTLAIEFMTEGKSICRKITHLESSIHVSRANLHPLIVKCVNKLC